MNKGGSDSLQSRIDLWARKILPWMGNIASFEMYASKQSLAPILKM